MPWWGLVGTLYLHQWQRWWRPKVTPGQELSWVAFRNDKHIFSYPPQNRNDRFPSKSSSCQQNVAETSMCMSMAWNGQGWHRKPRAISLFYVSREVKPCIEEWRFERLSPPPWNQFCMSFQLFWLWPLKYIGRLKPLCFWDSAVKARLVMPQLQALALSAWI